MTDILKTLILVVLGVAFGWFTRSAIHCAIERIYDWREDARWALAALFCIVYIWFIV